MYDSVRIVPYCKDYVMKGYVPYESELTLMFQKYGPYEMKLLAHPQENLELYISKEDNKIGASYKPLSKGSEAHNSLVTLWTKLYDFANKKRVLEDSIALYGIQKEKRDELASRLSTLLEERRQYQKKVALTSLSPFVAHEAQFLQWGDVSKEEFNALRDSVQMRFPDYEPIHVKKWDRQSERSKELLKFIRQIGTDRISFKLKFSGAPLAVGQQLQIVLIDSMKHAKPISDYKGKFVLIEMWASWCYPCIKAMPNIIRAKQLFSKDFVCCAITIDKDESSWKKAIHEFALQELLHYKGTDEEGKLLSGYERFLPNNTIPQNYLLDRDGKIIAVNIYGEDLIKKLEELTKE